MNPSGYIAQPECPGEALNVDRPYDAEELPELIDAIDPTEDLANDVTSQLPNPGTWTTVAPLRVITANADVAESEAFGNATIVTSGSVLRERYVLEQQLGNGGTAIIFRARDLRRNAATDDSPHVAIKLLRPEFRDRPQCIERLRREFRQTQSLAHPNVVRFYDLDCDRGTWFIAMEPLTGEALGQRLRRASPQGLPIREALRIAAACADALAFAHDHGVTHGDVKPDNVFVTVTDEVRVLDFGVAPESVLQPPPADSSMADPVWAAATRAYASPEVLTGQSPEPRDDVFSLACVIYEMLAGRHPYGRRGADEARDARLEIEPLPGLSTQQWLALAAGLAWGREQRPADVRELLRALATDAPSQLPMLEVVALPVRVVEGELLRPSSKTWRSATTIGVAIVLGVLIGRFGFESGSEPESVLRGAPTIAVVTAGNASTSGVAAGVGAAAIADPETTVLPSAVPTVIVSRAGPPMQAGRVSFDSASMMVSRRTVAAALPVRRLDHEGRNARIGWRAIDGTAVAGRDYGGPGNGVASFSGDHAFRMIYVPIVNDAQAAGDRSFTVELTDASPGASLGSTPRIIVTILGDG